MKKKNKITMSDVAIQAGVSQSTVSLVLSQSESVKLSEETRQRVWECAVELGYTKIPQLNANEDKLIDELIVLVNTIPGHDPFTDAFNQIRETAFNFDALASIYDYGDNIDTAKKIIEKSLKRSDCVGIILASNITVAMDFSPFAGYTDLPIVLLNTYDPNFPLMPTFIPDDHANAFQITQHLIKQGAKRIAHIIGELWYEATSKRLSGYRDALRNGGIPFDETLVKQGNWIIKEAYQATIELMQSESPPDAIICSSDWMAMGCYHALAHLQKRIPEDILVVGYDDHDIAIQLSPPLSSISISYGDLGRQAAEYICAGEDAALAVKVAGKLKIRESTSRKLG